MINLFRALKDIAYIKRLTYTEVLMNAYKIEQNRIYLPVYYAGKYVCYAHGDASLLKSDATYYELTLNELDKTDNAVYYALILNSGVFKTYMDQYPTSNRRVQVKASVLGDFKIPYIDDADMMEALVKVEKTIEHLLWCNEQGLSLNYAELKMSTFELLREALAWSLYCEPIMEKHQLHVLSDWKSFYDKYSHIQNIDEFVDEVLQQFIIYENPLKSEVLMASFMESELKSYYNSQL